MSKWALNETALMTEMLMSSGTIRSITVGTKHISKNGVHSTSPFTLGNDPDEDNTSFVSYTIDVFT